MNGTMYRGGPAKRPRFVRSVARMAKLADAADLKAPSIFKRSLGRVEAIRLADEA